MSRRGLTLIAVAVAVIGASARQPALPLLGILDASVPIPYAIASSGGASGHVSGDATLARWALGDWERALGGALRFRPSTEADALIRVAWVPASGGVYGEMQPFLKEGQRGAIVHVHPVTAGLGPEIGGRARLDPLFRDAVVYLTCLHELGHALGLNHTADEEDIMYFFGYGGDVPGFFSRYYERLVSRDDIRRESGLSAADVRRVRALYRGP